MKPLSLLVVALFASLASFAIGPITGANAVCIGSTVTLSDTTAGGTWSSSNISVATIGATGIVTGVSAGTSIITYAVGSGYVTSTITVNQLPPNVTVTNGTYYHGGGCPITVLTSTPGVRYSLYTGSAICDNTVGSGGTAYFNILLPGHYYVIASNPSIGCAQIMSDSAIVTSISSMPSPIIGVTTICKGSSSVMSDSTTGGIWSSANTGITVIGSSSGIITGVASGTTTVSYRLPTGCIRTTTITVNPLPLPIIGLSNVGVGSSRLWIDATHSGFWSSINTVIATIGSGTGMVRGVSVGTTTIKYSLPITGCFVTKIISVH